MKTTIILQYIVFDVITKIIIVLLDTALSEMGLFTLHNRRDLTYSLRDVFQFQSFLVITVLDLKTGVLI